MYALYGSEYLQAQAEGGGEAEGGSRLGPAQLREIPALQLHYDIVETVVSPAANEPTDVLFALKFFQDGHFHFQDLFRLPRRLYF